MKESKKIISSVDLGSDSSAEGCDVDVFERMLGYRFKSQLLLQASLTHRSLRQVGGADTHYERFEFLGDAVLDLAIAELLLEEHDDADEGKLSKMRAALVKTTALASLANDLQLSDHIRLSRSEVLLGGAARPSILADVLEALIGAVFFESGYESTREVIRRIFGNKIKNISPSDPKTELQERLHALMRITPEYRLECVDGPEHSPVFVSVVLIEGEVWGRGTGNSKKCSQQLAAAEALKSLEIRESGKK
jgi:ribonuclease-3